MKQNSRITMSISQSVFCTLCWQCEGFIYIASDSSRCGWYCGVNVFLGNASCLVIGLQCDLNGLYSWFCNRSRHYWRYWMVLLSSSVAWALIWARLREWPCLSYWVHLQLISSVPSSINITCAVSSNLENSCRSLLHLDIRCCHICFTSVLRFGQSPCDFIVALSTEPVHLIWTTDGPLMAGA